RSTVAKNLMEVAAVALVQTEVLLCHDLKNTDLKVRTNFTKNLDFFPVQDMPMPLNFEVYASLLVNVRILD
ncbi:hypothetical protein L195_g050816, partial [Trifolium pratense]